LKVALPLVALRFSSSPVLVSGVSVAFTLPWLVAALPAGAIVDRVDRRRAMTTANVVRASAVAVLVIALTANTGSIGLLYAVALLVGTAETVYDTAAQSILPMMISRERLARTNGQLFAVQVSMREFLGPPLGGTLVAVGVVAATATPPALWLTAAATLLLVPGHFRVERTGTTTLRAEITEGIRFLARHHLLRVLAGLVGLSNLATNATFAILVLYAVGPSSALGLTTAEYGILLTASAVGSIGGFLLAEPIQAKWGQTRPLKATIVTFALGIGTPAITTNPWLIATALVLGGAGSGVWNVITVSLRQHVTPHALLGRLNSAYRLLAWGSMPIGAALGGLLGQSLGLRTVFALFALLALAGIAPLCRITDTTIAAASHQP
jgi:MFS family permease